MPAEMLCSMCLFREDSEELTVDSTDFIRTEKALSATNKKVFKVEKWVSSVIEEL